MATYGIQSDMRTHLRVSSRALRRWFLAQCFDSLCVGLLWLAGLMLLGVPWAPMWALLAALLHFIPHFGSLIALVGPLCATVFDGNGWQGVLSLVLLYIIIVLVDSFFLQPRILRRVARVPLWASILLPLVLGYFLSFWGVLLAAPLLAVFFALRDHRREGRELPPPVEIIPPAISSPRRHHASPPTVIEG
ncbi:MAG TPA: AI-2E family transporter [Candidatus Koribacter sp.]|jgi:predicted PurR-regulated permease PerM